MSVEIKIDDRELLRRIKELGDAAEDGTIPLKKFDAVEKSMIGRDWTRHGKARGGTVRGEYWEPFAEKSPGVPAWGDGTHLGRKRPSGQRVTATSVANQDTGATRQTVISGKPVIRDKRLLLIGSDLTDYAEYIFGIGNRNPLRFDKGSSGRLFKIAKAYVDKLAKRFNR